MLFIFILASEQLVNGMLYTFTLDLLRETKLETLQFPTYIEAILPFDPENNDTEILFTFDIDEKGKIWKMSI